MRDIKSYILSNLFYKFDEIENLKNFDIREQEINKLYNEFLNRYKKLNDYFEIDNPLEIGGLYVYALRNGYLSENETFTFSTKRTDSIADNNGLNIFLGMGCCRHISTLLTDIYKKEKIESYSLCTYVESKKKEENTFYKKKIGNHVINLVYYNNEVYFFDPTNIKVYRKNAYSDSILTNGQNKIYMRQDSCMFINNKDEYEGLKRKLNFNFRYMDINEQYEIINNTFNLCKKNDSAFISFYRQNKELYHEINKKALELTY